MPWQLGIEHGPANTLMRELHEHAVVNLDTIVRSRMVAPGGELARLCEDSMGHNGSRAHGSMCLQVSPNQTPLITWEPPVYCGSLLKSSRYQHADKICIIHTKARCPLMQAYNFSC